MVVTDLLSPDVTMLYPRPFKITAMVTLRNVMYAEGSALLVC